MSKVEDVLCEEFKWYSQSESITKALIFEVESRAAVGFDEYGVTLERTDLSKDDWFQHLKEEVLDACNYATRLEMYEELTLVEKDILETLKCDLFHALKGIYENSLSE